MSKYQEKKILVLNDDCEDHWKLFLCVVASNYTAVEEEKQNYLRVLDSEAGINIKKLK